MPVLWNELPGCWAVQADAISYVRTEHAPSTVVDVATLTGACVRGLGAVEFCFAHLVARALRSLGTWQRDPRQWPLQYHF